MHFSTSAYFIDLLDGYREEPMHFTQKMDITSMVFVWCKSSWIFNFTIIVPHEEPVEIISTFSIVMQTSSKLGFTYVTAADWLEDYSWTTTQHPVHLQVICKCPFTPREQSILYLILFFNFVWVLPAETTCSAFFCRIILTNMISIFACFANPYNRLSALICAFDRRFAGKLQTICVQCTQFLLMIP